MEHLSYRSIYRSSLLGLLMCRSSLVLLLLLLLIFVTIVFFFIFIVFVIIPWLLFILYSSLSV